MLNTSVFFKSNTAQYFMDGNWNYKYRAGMIRNFCLYLIVFWMVWNLTTFSKCRRTHQKEPYKYCSTLINFVLLMLSIQITNTTREAPESVLLKIEWWKWCIGKREVDAWSSCGSSLLNNITWKTFHPIRNEQKLSNQLNRLTTETAGNK